MKNQKQKEKEKERKGKKTNNFCFKKMKGVGCFYCTYYYCI